MDSEEMKYKKNDWANFNDDRGLEVKYGIDVVIDGKTMHVSENGKPLFFGNEKERDERIKELNQSI